MGRSWLLADRWLCLLPTQSGHGFRDMLASEKALAK